MFNSGIKYCCTVLVIGLFLFFGFVFFPKATNAQRLDKSIKEYYRMSNGHLKCNRVGLAFPGMRMGDIGHDTIWVYNSWPHTMNFDYSGIRKHLTVKVFPDSLRAGQEGFIAVAYDTKIKGEYGRIVEPFFIGSNDTDNPDKRFFVSPNILQDFSGLSEDDRAMAPTIAFDEMQYDFGSIFQGDTIEHSYSFSNKGKSVLLVHSTRASCGCTKALAQKKEVKQNESSTIKVVFKSRGKKGEQKYRIRVVTNDPENPEAVLFLTGNVLLPGDD